MIDIEQVVNATPKEELEKIEQAMLDGADAKQIKDLFAAQGIDLDEKDIAKVSGSIISKILNDPSKSMSLTDEELDSVAGGENDWFFGKTCKG